MVKRSDKYMLWIAWRNLRVRRGRAGLSFMTTMSIAGIAIGVAALIIVLSVMGGFENDLMQKMLHGLPNVELADKKDAQLGFSLKGLPLSKLKEALPGIQSIQPFTKADVVIKQGKHMSSASLLGVNGDQKDVGKLWSFLDDTALIEGGKISQLMERQQDLLKEVELPTIILGESLAIQLGVNKGEIVEIISPNSDIDQVLGSGGAIIHRYVLAGTFRSGIFNYDSKWAVVSLEQGRKFMPEYDESLDEDQYVSGIALNIADPHQVDRISKIVEKQWPALQAVTWKTSNQSLLFALKLEKFTMGMILALVVVVAAFSISGTMMMTVYYKKSQVSLLRAIGMTKKGILAVFLAHGCFIGLIGILLGFGLGLGVCFIIYEVPTISLPQGVYYLKALPVKFLPWDYLVIGVGAFMFSLVAAVYPAIIAARQSPALGLRYH